MGKRITPKDLRRWIESRNGGKTHPVMILKMHDGPEFTILLHAGDQTCMVQFAGNWRCARIERDNGRSHPIHAIQKLIAIARKDAVWSPIAFKLAPFIALRSCKSLTFDLFLGSVETTPYVVEEVNDLSLALMAKGQMRIKDTCERIDDHMNVLSYDEQAMVRDLLVRMRGSRISLKAVQKIMELENNLLDFMEEESNASSVVMELHERPQNRPSNHQEPE